MTVKYCESCGKEHDGTFGSGRFCSSSCAHRRKHSIKTKNKIAKTLSSRPSKLKLALKYNYTYCIENPNINLPIRKCVVCGRLFYHTKDRKTCSSTCSSIRREEINKNQKGKPKNLKKKVLSDSSIVYDYRYYYTYKIINIVNNKYYYGMHMTNNMNDSYMGSGVLLEKAIKKYGKENFYKEIIQMYKDYNTLVSAEKALITEDVINDPNCYNLALGGQGGPLFKGKHHTQETKEKISKIVKKSHHLNFEN